MSSPPNPSSWEYSLFELKWLQTTAFHLPRAKAALDGGKTLMRAAKNINTGLNGPLRGLGPQEGESAGARAPASAAPAAGTGEEGESPRQTNLASSQVLAQRLV